jgi:hypothetical protein
LVVVGDVSHQEDLANILNCSISSLPLKFSRLPLGASFKLKAIWDVIVEKMEKKKKDWLVGRRLICLGEDA